jgi:hypothetical protein
MATIRWDFVRLGAEIEKREKKRKKKDNQHQTTELYNTYRLVGRPYHDKSERIKKSHF